MRTSMAYFAGAGTVVAAVVAGLGGGLMVANIISPHTPRHATEMSKLEQRMSAAPIPASNAPSDLAPYLAATQAAATKPVVVAPAPHLQRQHKRSRRKRAHRVTRQRRSPRRLRHLQRQLFHPLRASRCARRM
jgi:hypothetical protein